MALKKSDTGTRDAAKRSVSSRRGEKGNKDKVRNFASAQPLFICISVLSAMAMFYYHRVYMFLPSLIMTPCPVPQVVNHSLKNLDPSTFWGTYRANLYIGTGARSRLAPLFGAMWFWQSEDNSPKIPNIRHWCSQTDGLTKYEWIEHDGKNYGIQHIVDDALEIQATMLKEPSIDRPGNWAWRIDANVINNTQLSRAYAFIFYLAQPERTSLRLERKDMGSFTIEGDAPGIGQYRLHVSSVNAAFYSSYLKLRAIDLGDLDDVIRKSLTFYQSTTDGTGLIGLKNFDLEDEADLVAVQMNLIGNTTFEVVFESLEGASKANALRGDNFNSLLKTYRQGFERKFEDTFHLGQKGYADVFVKMAKHALSNMLGSVSYFHGSAIVQSVYNEQPVLYGPLELLSTVPSRPFFPRGFLWDEGFHQLLLHRWDSKLSLEIIGHWLDLMNVEGWIPREVILGSEALRKVPWEFVVQRNNIANPPVFFYFLNALLEKQHLLDPEQKALVKRMFPRLKLWYLWLNETQSGTRSATFRWRGRNETTILELNPKTLPSGMDDYPRASHPTNDEYHLDLYCWMTVSADCMAKLSEFVEDQMSARRFREYRQFLLSPDLMERLYWSNKTARFCDYGLHTKSVTLQQVRVIDDGQGQALQMQRIVTKEPTLRLVSDIFGYVNLFPLFLRLLPVKSLKLNDLLDQMTDVNLLWTPYGLRSLAKKSTCYNQRNTEHDPPYWRGSIWLNMNYLALSSLHYYSQQDGPYRDKIFQVYTDLRNAVIGNVIKQYISTGYLWEHYNDNTGAGEGSHPFTGWSSLVVLMMAEQFE